MKAPAAKAKPAPAAKKPATTAKPATPKTSTFKFVTNPSPAFWAAYDKAHGIVWQTGFTTTAKATTKPTTAKAAAKPATAKSAAKKAKAATVKKWSPDEQVALCSARAFAQSLRLALSVAVSDDVVTGTYFRTRSDPDAGQTIPETCGAIAETGWAGWYPRLQPASALTCACVPVILGITDPEPHAVVSLDGVWWSWGQPYEPWTDDVDEAWTVTWLQHPGGTAAGR